MLLVNIRVLADFDCFKPLLAGVGSILDDLLDFWELKDLLPDLKPDLQIFEGN